MAEREREKKREREGKIERRKRIAWVRDREGGKEGGRKKEKERGGLTAGGKG